jgi:hypothetical protein
MKVGALVHVSWIDSCASGGWRGRDGVSSATVCESVGWLVRDDPDSITVAGHRSESTDEWNGMMTIPKVAVKSIKRIGEKR